MALKRLIVPIILVISFLWTPTNTSVYGQLNDNFLVYNNDNHGIRIIYPSNWDVIEEFEEFGVNPGDIFITYIVAFQAPRESALDTITDSVIIRTMNLPDKFFDPTLLEFFSPLDILIEAQKHNLGQNIAGYNLIESSPVTIANNPGHKLVYTEVDQGDLMKTIDMFTIIGHRAYFVSYIAEESKFATYLPTVEKMIDSFEVG